MPPKHKPNRNPTDSQSTQVINSGCTCISDSHIEDSSSTALSQTGSSNSTDSSSIVSATDVLTIYADDRKYIQISKQILQYEMKRKRINVSTISESTHMEDDETSLPASITSDWRLILQDSVTIYDLRQGCISLFDQINSGLKLIPIEINHAIRFLEYACLHIKHRDRHHNQLLGNIFTEEIDYQSKLVSSLINLLSLPSNTLRTAVLSLLDVSLWNSTDDISFSMTVTGLVPQLFLVLKPHEIPLSDTTIKFHRHLTSIVDYFFSHSSPEKMFSHLKHNRSSCSRKQDASEIIESIFDSFCTYLRYLLTSPVSLTRNRSGFILLSTMRQFDDQTVNCPPSSSPSIRHYFGEIHKNMTEELVSMAGLVSASEAANCLHSGKTNSTNPNQERFVDELRKNMMEEQASSLDLATTRYALNMFFSIPWRGLNEHLWVAMFERFLVGVSEGKRISDLGIQAFLCFMSRRPSEVSLVFCPDGTFSLKIKDTVVSSSKLESKSLWTLFTQTQPHHAAIILDAIRRFLKFTDKTTYVKHIWNEWFPCFINAVDPSKLLFNFESITLHTKLIKMLDEHLTRIRDYASSSKHPLTDQYQSELNELFHAFYNQTKDYIVHLSLHPFALDNEREDMILDFLIAIFQYDRQNSLDEPCREELRKEMDASAISSSSPPFILTSEIACRLSDEEIVNVVDRIVAQLNCDSCLDDDTILQICTFIRMQLSRVYLPDLFRKAGRTTEQYFHTFESLLSLHIEYLERAPIVSLVTTRPDKEPTLDEWDDVDLERVGIVKQLVNQNQLSMLYESKLFVYVIVGFGIRSLLQARHSITRLSQPQLERLLAPSVDSLGKYFIQPRSFEPYEEQRCEDAFVAVCRLCDQSVVAQCVSRIGFFSRVVSGLFNENIDASNSLYRMITDREFYYTMTREDLKAVRRTIPYFLEEGLQDAFDFMFVKEKSRHDPNAQYRTKRRMQLFELNGSVSTSLPGLDVLFQREIQERERRDNTIAGRTT
ncbi:hypothetical protein BLNAU_15830 [Blattamonas nauphoetae]|uniref:Uncharacterized protein n=1 Tax=Blattamonas nauphoetae TaxID=2049346 RepID=A0ABQ9XF42_9EUKA|nr:hypothetical protein BLNAU_15830 [Blattamonas nauphoetae]